MWCGEFSDLKVVEIDSKTKLGSNMKVEDEEFGERLEIPVEKDAFMSLATLTSQLPGATELEKKIETGFLSANGINDLAPEILTQIFSYLQPQFWFKDLQSVCKLWQEVIEKIFCSITSIEFVGRPKIPFQCTLSIPSLRGHFSHQPCTFHELWRYVFKSSERLKKFHLFCDLKHPPPPYREIQKMRFKENLENLMDCSILLNLENCQNLTELALTHWLHFQMKEKITFPHLRTFALKQSDIWHVASTNEMAQRQSHLAAFLLKHSKISDLSINGFNPGEASFAAIGLLSLKKFHITRCYFYFYVDFKNLQPTLLDSVGRSAESLKHLDLEICAPPDWPASEAAFVALFEKLRCAKILLFLRLLICRGCRRVDENSMLYETVAVGLAALSSVKILYLPNFNLNFRPKLPQNKKLTAGKLLSSTFANLVALSLHSIGTNMDDFFVEVFSSGLPKLKKLGIDSIGISPSFYPLLCCWCPNLIFLLLFTKGRNFWSHEMVQNMHRNVHECRREGAECRREGAAAADSANCSQQRRKLRIAKIGEQLDLKEIEKLRLCGLKVENDLDISIFRDFCCNSLRHNDLQD